MKNALKYFNNKNLLEIDQFHTSDLQNRFHELAEVLLNQTQLEVNQFKYRLCEIEFYAYSEANQDPYTHQHPEQLNFGTWYFHQIKTKSGFSYKGGNYKGLDLTLGDGKNFLGILIRSIQSESTGKRIDGPSLVVDEILNCLKLDSITKLEININCEIFLKFNPSLESREFITGPRVGLRLLSEKKDSSLQFLFSPFRYITGPSKTKNYKALLFLHQVNVYGTEKAIERLGIRETEAKKYLSWFEAGRSKNVLDLPFSNNIEDLCIFFGAHNTYINSIADSETTEVTPEQLLEMAAQAFQEGDLDNLRYLCDIGIEACGVENLGLEFLKLRGLYHAQSGRLLEARKDLLTVLEITPNDAVAFSNYVTACLDSNDRPSALKAIKICYSSFDDSIKSIVLESIKEAVKVKTLTVNDLPEEVVIDLAQYLKIKKVG